jgi:hypothetical protein
VLPKRLVTLRHQLKELIDHPANQAGVHGAFNVLKISWSDFAVSFLEYEDFGIAERAGPAKLIDTS